MLRASTVSIADYRCRTKDLPVGLGFFGPLVLGEIETAFRVGNVPVN